MSPRRCSSRWLDGDCPPEVLALFDNGGATWDRYTVIYNDPDPDERGTLWMTYRTMSEHPSSPDGFGVSNTMTEHEAADLRAREHHHYTRWTGLPAPVRDLIARDCAAIRDER